MESYLQAGLNFLSFLSWRELSVLFWYFIYLEFPRYMVISLLALILHLLKKNPQRDWVAAPPLISVVIPAYNEEENILSTLSSLFQQSYPNLEIIVIDDGSSDGTQRACRPIAEAGKIIYLRNELRGGKSSAANLGFYYSKGEYIITLDADTVLKKDAALNILNGFSDPRVGAVSGNLRISNAGQNLLTKMQAIHYLMTISLGRMATAWLDILLIVSGAFGIYRRELIETTGGWDAGSGEDADLTLKARKRGAKIAFAPQAVCWTKAPDNIPAFIKQQRRWSRSLIRNQLRKHGDFLNPLNNHKFTNFLGALEVLFFQGFLAYSFLFYLVWLFINYRHLMIIVLFSAYLLYLAANTVQFFIAWLFSGYKKEDLSLFIYLPLYCLFDAYFLRFVRIWAYTEELCLRSSHRDPHVPVKVREKMIKW